MYPTETTTQPQTSQRLLRITEFAKLAAVGTRTAYRLIEAGQVRAVRLGGALRVPASEIDRLCAGRPIDPVPPTVA